MRLARVEQLDREGYSIDDIAFFTGEPKFTVETNLQKVRKKRYEKEQHDQYVRDMMFGGPYSDRFAGVIH
jgi:hypothetical protein